MTLQTRQTEEAKGKAEGKEAAEKDVSRKKKAQRKRCVVSFSLALNLLALLIGAHCSAVVVLRVCECVG